MNIPIGNYTITSDPHQLIINEIRTIQKDSKDGKSKKGDQYLATGVAFLPHLEAVANWLVDHGIYGSEATTLDALSDDIGRLRRELVGELKEAVKQ